MASSSATLSVPRTCDEVREVLNRHLPDLLPPDAMLEGPVYRGTWSRVYKATLPDGSAFALKFCIAEGTGDAPWAEAAAGQFDAQRELAGLLGAGRYRVAAPVALGRAHALLVLPWLAAPNLGRRVHRPWEPPGRLAFAVEEAGAWLGHLHRSSAAQPKSFPVDGALDHLEDVLGAAPAIRDRADVASAVALLRGAARHVAGLPVPRASLHGDYKSSNVVVTPDATYGLDIAAVSLGPTVTDIVQFLSDLDLMLLDPRGLLHASARNALRRRFLTGYTRICAAPNRLVMDWLCAHSAVRLWAVLGHRRAGKLRDRYDTLRHAFCLRRAVATLRAGTDPD